MLGNSGEGCSLGSGQNPLNFSLDQDQGADPGLSVLFLRAFFSISFMVFCGTISSTGS